MCQQDIQVKIYTADSKRQDYVKNETFKQTKIERGNKV